jgi:hypothetical protein
MAGTEALGPPTVIPFDGHDTKQKDADSQVSQDSSWWIRYRQSLHGRLSDVAVDILRTDATYIVDRAVPVLEGSIDVAAWGETGLRTGMVVGSVQSGKTASMLGVAALGLDRGVDLVILLAGTRVGLWLQTYERLLSQLDGSDQESAFRRNSKRLILPQPADILNASRADAQRYLHVPMARRALADGRPVIVVVPKEDDHLLHLQRFLMRVVDDAILSGRALPLTMLLLDDEADDASILDSKNSKLTPRLISALWSGDTDEVTSRHRNLLASYVAYTATPQSNYLQSTHNPLSPKQFQAALRLPGSSGALTPRSLTYAEPTGIAGYYCGGEIFYGRGGAELARLCNPTVFPVIEDRETQSDFEARQRATKWAMLSDALRSFFVGAALRVMHSGKAVGKARSRTYSDVRSALAASPPIHTMLFHPSAKMKDHLDGALDIIRWCLAEPGLEDAILLENEDGSPWDLTLPVSGLLHRLDAEEPEWMSWLTKFEISRAALASLPEAPYEPIHSGQWAEVRRVLVEDIFPNTVIRVLNSDPLSDDRPRFLPELVDDEYVPAPDLLAIFVAGNVLSRGLTLEGLTTSLFLRGANDPAADTQMQMQRWFGYRGQHLPFCRLFAFADQLALFAHYNENDKALKSEIMRGMGSPDDSVVTSALILQGMSYVATSKVASQKVPLSPGPRPSIRLVETMNRNLALRNLNWVNDLREAGSWETLEDKPSSPRGVIRTTPVNLLEAADILDGLSYSHHDPDPENELSKRWYHYEVLLGLTPLFKPPGLRRTAYAVEPQSCPYSIAAYLRLWHFLSSNRKAPGFFPTDKPGTPWVYAEGASTGPDLYVAIRYGNLESRNDRLAARGVKPMVRQLAAGDLALQTLWGTRGYTGSYLGDELVDYYHHRSRPIPSLGGGATWRPKGHPGLILIHVVRDDRFENDLVAVGLGLPHGGPDHIVALRT